MNEQIQKTKLIQIEVVKRVNVRPKMTGKSSKEHDYNSAKKKKEHDYK